MASAEQVQVSEEVEELNGAAEDPDSVAAQPVEPEEPAGPVIVSELDRLKAENLNLKLLNLINSERLLQQQVADIQNRQLPDLGRERAALNEQMQSMRLAIEQRYKINLNTHHIKPDDGTVIPRNQGVNPQAADLLRQMQAQLGKRQA